MIAKDTLQPLEAMREMGHENVFFCNDSETGLKAIIAIHNTNLGPALGGTRMWNYVDENAALVDVLRLSRGMSYKAAISGLKLGGGKAVIIGDAKRDKTDALMQKFGEFVDRLSGKYITAEDVGMTTHDMEMVRKTTAHVTGIPEHLGGAGDPSPYTAYGVYMGMKASAQFALGNDSLSGKTIWVQGVGSVGENLVKHLAEEDANIFISDIDDDKLLEVAQKYGATVASEDMIAKLKYDIYAPCALGATLNDQSIASLPCKIVAGAANNQLANEKRHAQQLKDRGIVYAPDFLINAGGLINVYSEVTEMTKEDILRQTKEIYDTTLRIFERSAQRNYTTQAAAMEIAEETFLK